MRSAVGLVAAALVPSVLPGSRYIASAAAQSRRPPRFLAEFWVRKDETVFPGWMNGLPGAMGSSTIA